MNRYLELDASELLQRVAEKVPSALRANVVVIGSIATAWAFRDVSGIHSVATKDIDLLLRPAVDAVATAETLGHELLEEGWQPQFSQGRTPGNKETPDNELPALRLSPPGDEDGALGGPAGCQRFGLGHQEDEDPMGHLQSRRQAHLAEP